MIKKKFLTGTLVAFILILAAGALYLNSLLPIITGYAAKNLCSNVFVSGRDAQSIEATDLNFSFIRYTKNVVDKNEKSVTSRFLWGKSKAIYREGFGATLVTGIPEEELRKSPLPVAELQGFLPDTTAWPLGDILPDTIPSGIDKSKLNDITRKIIDDNGYMGNAFAFMVLYKGIPVAEAYKPGFNAKTRFLSWSVAKSFTNGLIGALVRDGKIDINKPAAIEEWKADDRNKITLNDLMQMQSGLKWNEDYGSRSDVNLMLFDKADMARYAIEQPLEHPAGTYWYYSSGSANIVSELAGNLFPDRPSFTGISGKPSLRRPVLPMPYLKPILRAISSAPPISTPQHATMHASACSTLTTVSSKVYGFCLKGGLNIPLHLLPPAVASMVLSSG